MSFRLDRYSFEAEALPTLLAFAPASLLIAVNLPEEMTPVGVLLKVSPLVALAALSFVASQVGADLGKRLEDRLWARWSGPPTTRFLRHGNKEYNEITRRAVHEGLIALGFRIPTAEEQLQDPNSSDKIYSACTAELRRLTRNRKEYPLVHKRLIDYGFRRNMLGLRWIGLSIAVVVSLVCTLQILWFGSAPGSIGPLLFVGTVCAGLGVCWLTLVNEKAVSLGAERYAHTLLESAIDME